MKGLRTKESNKFENFFEIVQKKASEKDCVFFLESGDGNDFKMGDMEGEDLQGWLIPKSKVANFETLWEKNKENDEWVDFFCWVKWRKKEDKIEIAFESE